MTDTSQDNMEALHEQRDWLLVTLSCIGDAVITTDREGRVTFLNPVAESLTGWTQEAVGQPLDGVIRIINEESRQPVEIPTVEALRDGQHVKLASHSLLIARDSTERSISDSAAPITNDKGEVAGERIVVEKVFRCVKVKQIVGNNLNFFLRHATSVSGGWPIADAMQIRLDGRASGQLIADGP